MFTETQKCAHQMRMHAVRAGKDVNGSSRKTTAGKGCSGMLGWRGPRQHMMLCQHDLNYAYMMLLHRFGIFGAGALNTDGCIPPTAERMLPPDRWSTWWPL